MYIYEKSELTEHPMFDQAVMLSEMTAKATWESLYRDKSGELAIKFKGHLNESQIKTILMHFKDLLDGDTNVDNISCKNMVDYAYGSSNQKGRYTQVFTPDGYDYSQF